MKKITTKKVKQNTKPLTKTKRNVIKKSKSKKITTPNDTQSIPEKKNKKKPGPKPKPVLKRKPRIKSDPIESLTSMKKKRTNKRLSTEPKQRLFMVPVEMVMKSMVYTEADSLEDAIQKIQNMDKSKLKIKSLNILSLLVDIIEIDNTDKDKFEIEVSK